MIWEGKVWIYGDDIDTDVIIPARYLNTSDPGELAVHCLEDLDPEFAGKVQPGDFIVAGKNFGCGSSREHAPMALKATGISGVIAASFARIFYRNALNIGLPIWECPEMVREIRPEERIRADLQDGVISILDRSLDFKATPFPPFMQQLIRDGGLVNYVKKKAGKTS